MVYLLKIKNKYMTKTKKGFDVPEGFPIPLNQSVIIEREKSNQTTKSGLIITDATNTQNIGIIMSVGYEMKNKSLKPGMKVLYSSNTGREIIIDENIYLLLHELDLFCYFPSERAIVVPEGEDKNLKQRNEKLDQQQKYLNNKHKEDMNKADKIMEDKKKKFNKKK